MMLKLLLATWLAAWAAAAGAAVPGTLLRDEVLLAAPAAGAARLGSLPRDTAVQVLARQGGWSQVRAGNLTGWVRILSVRTQAPGAGVRDLAAIAGQREGRQVVAVAGLRGLSERQLQTARFDARGVQELEGQRIGRPEAAEFGRAANLASHTLDYLPAPQPAARPGHAPAGGNGFWWKEGQ